EWMQRDNDFGHAWPDGTRVGDRLTMANYEWQHADENIAAGFRTLPEVIQAWIDSPSHCRALMRRDVSETGLAVVPGAPGNTYVSYWTMVVAEPASNRREALQ
ncbi:MAG: CAP domain-containing protein, partial [Burkholderiaceae bacterium]